VNNNVLITGASGFVGEHLKKYLSSQAMKVIELPDSIDIRNKDNVTKFCSNYSFDFIIHLAAQSFVPNSISNPRETYDINFIGTLNLLEALKCSNFKGVFLFVGSSDVYGTVAEEQLPIKEYTPIIPRSPYAVSKIAAEMLCKQWSISEDKMRILMTRSFNHIGPMQDERFVISGFCKQVAMIKYGLQKPCLTVGNLKVSRDFTDVRDVVRAYHMLLQGGLNGASYNVCSGQEIYLESILSELRQIANIDFRMEVISDLYRDAEQVRAFGSYDKINNDVGWSPKILFNQSLLDVYNYWLDTLKKDSK
jgi:GDP-4-dehydro-6-deoxy-D-mannose reductase